MKPLDIQIRCNLHPAAAVADCPRCVAVIEMNQANELMHHPEVLAVKKEWAHEPADARRGP